MFRTLISIKPLKRCLKQLFHIRRYLKSLLLRINHYAINFKGIRVNCKSIHKKALKTMLYLQKNFNLRLKQGSNWGWKWLFILGIYLWKMKFSFSKNQNFKSANHPQISRTYLSRHKDSCKSSKEKDSILETCLRTRTSKRILEQLTKINTNAKPRNHLPKTKTCARQQPMTATSLKEHSQFENPFELKSSAKQSFACKIPPCINPKQTDKPYIVRQPIRFLRSQIWMK